MRLPVSPLCLTHAPWASVASVVCALALGACGQSDAAHEVWAPALQLTHAAASDDANMRQALAAELSHVIADGTLSGRGLWQRGPVRRKGHADPVALPDDAQQGIVDGYQYQAYLTPPPPRIARADGACAQAEDWPVCDDIEAHTHVALERVGGIAGLTWRSDILIAYQQSDHIYLCACPPSALTERLPLCCSSLCCH